MAPDTNEDPKLKRAVVLSREGDRDSHLQICCLAFSWDLHSRGEPPYGTIVQRGFAQGQPIEAGEEYRAITQALFQQQHIFFLIVSATSKRIIFVLHSPHILPSEILNITREALESDGIAVAAFLNASNADLDDDAFPVHLFGPQVSGL